MTGSKLLLSLTVVGCSTVWAQSPQPSRFGEKINLSYGASVIVKRMNAAELRSRNASDFPAGANLAAFEVRWGKEGRYFFHVDRDNPARSDIVAMCGAERVNMIKISSGAPEHRDEYKFVAPGGYQLMDGRWVVIASGGDPPSVMVFDLPASCVASETQLLAAITVRDVGTSTEKKVELLFADEGSKKP
jgi:hypothetical protein